MDIMSSFDRLVISMPQSERMALYDKLTASINPDEQIIVEAPLPQELASEENDIAIEEKLKNESPLFKFYLFLRSLFAGVDTTKMYNEIVLQKQAKIIEKKFPDLFSAKRKNLKSGFYNQLKLLKTVADFFIPSINLYEEEPGRFYVFLSSILIPDIYIRIEQEADPFLLSSDKEPCADVRSAQLHKMDEIFQEITGSDRKILYTAVTNIDWLRQFVRLPFEKMFARFLALSTSEHVCQIDACTTELAQFARVLCNGKSISTDILQALFLFSIQSQLADPTINVDEMTTEYIRRSMLHIGTIKKFLKEVPLRSLGCIAFQSITWTPQQPEGVEDWFVKYKGEWRKLFDDQWDNWVIARKKEIVEKKMQEILSISESPLLPYRPWLEIWTPMKFKRSLAMGFLWNFFKKPYVETNKALKILLRDGDFKIRENGVEFAEAFKEMNTLATDMLIYGDKFAATGDVGSAFAEAIEKNDRTVHTYSRLESVMTAASSDAVILSSRFTKSATRISNVLNGVVSDTKKNGYDSINNIAAIQGRQNQHYRHQLEKIRDDFDSAISCLKELELLEK